MGQHLGEEWIADETGEKVKIAHFLTHTGGYGSFFNNTYWTSPRSRFKSVDDYKVLVTGDTPQFESGIRWSYSNTGFIFPGAVVEKASGKDYFDYVREHIYKSAGMISTDCYDMELPVPNLVIGYEKIKNEHNELHWKNNLFKHEVKGSPDFRI